MPLDSILSARVPLARAVLRSVSLAGVAIVALAGAADGADLVVRYDQSQLLRMPRPISEVIIGNPSIADVAVQGGNLLVVTGKTFGVTNIIALDEERNVIQDQRVIVQRDEERSVNLTKAGTRQSYSCTPYCSPTLTIGDETTYFDTISKHATTKTRFSDSTSDPNGAQQGNQ